MRWYFAALKKYAVFRGRARRKEYWLYALFNCIVCLVLVGLFAACTRFGVARPRLEATETRHFLLLWTGYYFMMLYYLYSMAVVVPSIAVAVRRLHDTGPSGWWLLLGVIPVLGGLALLVLLVRDSTPGENRFGPNPKCVGVPVPAILSGGSVV